MESDSRVHALELPVNQTVRKLSAALAAGCSIIVKAPAPPPAAPAELLGAFVDAGVTAGGRHSGLWRAGGDLRV